MLERIISSFYRRRLSDSASEFQGLGPRACSEAAARCSSCTAVTQGAGHHDASRHTEPRPPGDRNDPCNESDVTVPTGRRSCSSAKLKINLNQLKSSQAL
jgi:hypothetical protein